LTWRRPWKSPLVATIFRRDEVVGHTYVKHDIHVQYAVVSIAVSNTLPKLGHAQDAKSRHFPYVK